jgi:aquaporin related protein
MATNEPSPLPQYYGQQLQDGTMMSSPIVPRHKRSSEDRQELLRLPMQPHPVHIDQNLDPISPTIVRDSSVIPPQSVSRRLGGPGLGYSSEYGTPSAHRHRRGPSTQVSQRRPYVEDYPSDEEEYEMRPRRRPSRQPRLPPSAYENDLRYGSRYASLPGRGSFDPGRGSIDAPSTYNNDKPRYHMSYGSEDEYAQRRPGVAGNSRGPPRNLPPTDNVMRLPWMLWMGSNAKNHFVAFIGEFVGTTMFLFFAFAGTQVANIGASSNANSSTTGEATGFSPEVLIYISVVFGFSLMVNVWVFFRISGGLFNPAVTFAMLLTRSLSPVRAFLLLAAQLSGSIFSSFLVSVLFPTPFNVRTTLSTGTSIAQGVFIEAILTAELVFTIFMLAKEKHKGPSPPSSRPPLPIHLTPTSNLHRTRRHRPRALHRRARRRILHWRVPQPRSQFRTVRRHRHLRRRTLDLLGWSCRWRRHCRCILQVHQDT